jgi:hypothetical protein
MTSSFLFRSKSLSQKLQRMSLSRNRGTQGKVAKRSSLITWSQSNRTFSVTVMIQKLFQLDLQANVRSRTYSTLSIQRKVQTISILLVASQDLTSSLLNLAAMLMNHAALKIKQPQRSSLKKATLQTNMSNLTCQTDAESKSSSHYNIKPQLWYSNASGSIWRIELGKPASTK